MCLKVKLFKDSTVIKYCRCRCLQRWRRLTAVEFIRLVVTIQNAVAMLARWNTLSIAALKLASSTVYTTARQSLDSSYTTAKPLEVNCQKFVMDSYTVNDIISYHAIIP